MRHIAGFVTARAQWRLATAADNAERQQRLVTLRDGCLTLDGVRHHFRHRHSASIIARDRFRWRHHSGDVIIDAGRRQATPCLSGKRCHDTFTPHQCPNHGSSRVLRHWPVTHVTRSHLLTYLIHEWPMTHDPLSAWAVLSVAKTDACYLWQRAPLLAVIHLSVPMGGMSLSFQPKRRYSC